MSIKSGKILNEDDSHDVALTSSEVLSNQTEYSRPLFDPQKAEIQLKAILNLLLFYRWYLVGSVILFTILGWSISAFFTPIYESEGTVIISSSPNRFTMAGNDISSLLMSSYGIGLGTSISNELEILNSRSLGYTLLKKIFDERFDVYGRLYPILWRDYPKDSTLTTIDTVFYRVMTQKIVSQKGNNLSNILTIAFRSPSPLESQRMVDLIIDTYSETSTESNKKQVKSALNFLNKELVVVKENVTTYEESLRNFLNQSEIVEVNTQTVELIRTLSRLEGEKKANEVKLAATKEGIRRYTEEMNLLKPGFAKRVSQALAPYIQRMQVQLAEMQTERILLLTKNPDLRDDSVSDERLIKLNDQIQFLENEIYSKTSDLVSDEDFLFVGFINNTDGGVASKLQNYREQLIRLQVEEVQFETQIAVLDQQIQEYEVFYDKLPDYMIELARKKRELMINEQLYVSLAKQSAELMLWEQTQSGLARVVDLAYVPSEPIEPRTKLFVLGGFSFGILFFVAFVFIKEFGTNVINSVEKMKDLGYPIIGTIPELKYYIEEQFDGKEFIEIQGNLISTGLVTLLDSISPTAEAYRRLQSNILYSRPDHPYQVILTTSSNKSEGKTTLSSNLAITFAETGRKVLIVDCDFRRPRIHKIFGVEMSGGVVDSLFSDENPLHFIKASQIENLYLFTIGVMPPNPSEIIRSAGFKKMIHQLREHFDFIILDTPPYGIITDAAPLMHLADGIVVVAKFNQTLEGEFKLTLDNLNKIKAPILGLAMTAFDAKKTSGYYYADYYYQYSYESYNSYDKRAED